MPGPFEKESKVFLWILLGTVILGLAATFIYLNFVPKESTPVADSKSQPYGSAPTSSSNNANTKSEKLNNDPRKNIYADPPPGHRSSDLNGLLSNEGFEKELDKRLAESATGNGDQSAKGIISFGESVNGDSYSKSIAMVVKARISGIKYCFEKELKNQPGLSGKIVANWTIGPNGDVIQYKIESSSVENPEVGDCTLRMIRRWRFPQPPDGEVNVSYPFIFTAQK